MKNKQGYSFPIIAAVNKTKGSRPRETMQPARIKGLTPRETLHSQQDNQTIRDISQV